MAEDPGMAEPNHGRRVALLTIAASAIMTPLAIFALGPHLPPGNGSAQASAQVTDNTVLTAVMTPIVCLVLVYFAYAAIVFRQRGAEIEEGSAVRGHGGIQTAWIAATSAIVLFLAGYGTWALLQTGSGAGQGPVPMAAADGAVLPVQVIAQQWAFTYRYPTFGGLETSQLVLPANTQIELHVTSLDAIHSFWAYDLGVKADANPGTDNVAIVRTGSARSFDVRCAEVCGLWHGYMADTGQVVSASAFATWVADQQKVFAPVAGFMPPYSPGYQPDPQRRAG
jgi:cytochrome c oxidase subunit 2